MKLWNNTIKILHINTQFHEDKFYQSKNIGKMYMFNSNKTNCTTSLIKLWFKCILKEIYL